MRHAARGFGFRTDPSLRHHEGVHVADVHHPDGIIEGVVVDHEARMGGVLEHLQQVAQRNVLLHGDDVGSRHHDIVDPALAQAQDVLEHAALFRREPGFGPLPFEQHLQVGADRSRAPAEHRPQQPVQPGFRILPRRAAGAPCRSRKVALAGAGGDRIAGRSRIAVGHGTGFKHRGRHRDRECPGRPGYRVPTAPSVRPHRRSRDRTPKDAENHGPPNGRGAEIPAAPAPAPPG